MTRTARLAAAALLAAAAPAARAESPVLTTGESLRINGYVSAEYERVVGDPALGPDAPGDRNGSFDADLFDLVLHWRGSDRLRLAADVTWEHGPATEDGYGNVAVEYAFLEYAVADWAKVRAGKMFTPFGIYNEIHTAKPVYLSVKEPFSTNRNDKFGSALRFYPRWGMGAALVGNGALAGIEWDYVIAVTNGENTTSENPFEADDNKQKAVAGRVRAVLADQLELGASGYLDELTELDASEAPTAGRTRLASWGAQLTWRPRFIGLGVELEAVAGTVTPSASSGLARTRRWGASAMAWWWFAERVAPYLRFEYLDPDTGVASDQAQLLLAGLNARIAGAFHVKLEADFYKAGAANARFAGGDRSYSEVKAAAVLGF